VSMPKPWPPGSARREILEVCRRALFPVARGPALGGLWHSLMPAIAGVVDVAAA